MAEQQQAKTKAELADEARLKRELVQLEREELELEETREATAQRKAERGQKARKVEMSQATLQKARENAHHLAKACAHRQGGQNGNLYKGKGPTALKVEKHPDGFTIKIRCLNCPLRVTSPFPPNGSKKLKQGETPADRDVRVAKFKEDKERFDRLYEMSQEDALSAEAAQAMESGMTFKFLDDDGNQIYKPRPSDTYAMEMAS